MQFTAEELRAITTTCTQMGSKMSVSLGFVHKSEVVMPSQPRRTHTRMRLCFMLSKME